MRLNLIVIAKSLDINYDFDHRKDIVLSLYHKSAINK